MGVGQLDLSFLCTFAGLLLYFANCFVASGPVENLEVKIEEATGGFQLYLSGKLWFNSADGYVHNNGKWYSTQDGSLTMTGKSTATGELDWGPMDITNFNWKDSDGKHYTTYAVVFQEIPVVIFGQQWDDGGNETSLGKDDTTLSMWPTLRIEDHPDLELGYTTWADGQIHLQPTGKLDTKIKEIYNGADGGFPVAFFDSKMENTLVIAPQNTFMSGHQTVWKPDEYDVPVWGSGLLGTVESIPAGYSMETVMVAGQNVSDTMDKWGKLMRKRYGKSDDYRLTDYTINYLGYYTDNGACYYYYTGEYKNYEEALIAVKAKADETGIPYRYIQLDSWWYVKGQDDGVKNWTAMSSIFPRGIEYVSNQTNCPMVAHNRFFSVDNVYAKQNGGNYNFIIDKDEKIALPDDVRFWQDLLKHARDSWNLKVYEQDWLLTAFGRVKELQMDLGLGKTWLGQMGEAAKELGLTIQYCMSWPRHVLQSVMLPAVTQMRVSVDYHPGNDNWQIGDSTMLAHALGIAAFKDNFRTLTKEENCKFTNPEPYPALETYIAALTGGPVGPSDTASAFNKTLIMATCMTDGLLLKPTKPTMSIDGTFLQRAFGTGGPDGKVYSSYTVVSRYAWYQIISVDLNADYKLMPREFPSCSVYKPQTYYPESVALQYNLDGTIRGDAVHIKQNTDVIPLKKCERDDFEYWIVAPVFPGTGGALLGELNKIITVSEQRVLTVIKFGDTYVVKLRGSPGEVVYMSTYDLSSSKIVTVECTIASDGTGSLAFSEASKLSC